MNQLFQCRGHSGDNSTVTPHLPIALDAGISSFKQRGAFVKENVQDGRVCEKKAWNEWDSLFFAVRRSLGAVRFVNWRCRVWLFGGCCERDCKWNPTVSTCCIFWNRQTTSTEPTFALRCNMQWRRKIFLIVLCLVMSLRFISMGKCTDIMCVYGVLKILMRWCHMKGLPQRSMFFAQCPPEMFMGLSFSLKTPWREQVIWKCYRHGCSLDYRKMNQRTSLCSRMGSPAFSSRLSSLVERRFSSSMDRAGCSWGLDFLSVACTIPRFNPLWLLPLELSEGQSVCATTTRDHTWFEEQNYRGCGDHHTWQADQSVAGIGLSPRCVPCDQACKHRTFVGMYHTLVELFFHYY